ncbi:hypothetical protein D3C81_1215990 [compost metagenome]
MAKTKISEYSYPEQCSNNPNHQQVINLMMFPNFRIFFAEIEKNDIGKAHQ